MVFSWHMRNCKIQMEMTAKPSPKLHYAYSTTLFLVGLLPSRAPLCFKSQYKAINYSLKQVKTDDIFSTRFDP